MGLDGRGEEMAGATPGAGRQGEGACGTTTNPGDY